MGEIKSVKVDNWGVFFLQKLQNFFNKTDYCDLTLQFRDNSQLKVHRLVLSACTDFFNVLEQTCEMVDDALIMPNELQADVVVPIVNFMYTGTLEFELKMYGKLLRTAKEMNMTVLLKLLEAHRRTMEGVNRANRPPSPKSVRRRPTMTTTVGSSPQQQVSQQRRILTPTNTLSQSQRRIVQTKTMTTNTGPSTSTGVSPLQMQYRQQTGASQFTKPSAGSNNTTAGGTQMRAQYGNVTVYETAVKQEPDEQMSTSPFEQLRKGYNNNKRPATSTFISPPSKKLNIEDVKEFAEQQRMRKQIAAEYGEDHGEYDNSIMDDDIHNDDDDDDIATPSMPTTSSAQASTSRQTQLQHGATTITINQNEKPPTIVVKDSSNSKMNHAKIIKEVLRQYPHLVKSNKNIKLKIMPNVGDQPQKIIVKKEQPENVSSDIASSSGMPHQSQQSVVIRTQSSPQTLLKPQEKSLTNNQMQAQTQQSVSSKDLAQQKAVVNTSLQASSAAVPAQKRRIDSKTMHALIALGAENTTGPWLCLRCGVNGRPISIPSYRGFRRHLINTHKETIDPALCEHCGLRSNNNRELHYHTEVEHNIKTTSYTFPECLLCDQKFLNTNILNQHMVDAHPDENKQQCIYCNKIFAREMQLYTHMKTYHKKQALEDGIIDYSDEEFPGSQDEAEIEQHSQTQSQNQVMKEKKDTKIKILSDISLPSTGTILKLEPGSDAANLSNVASTIAANIGIANAQEYMETHEGTVVTAETKFVNVDGNEMLLTEEQRKEIMLQLNQEHGTGGVVMVLNEPTEFATETVTQQTTVSAQDIVEKVAENATVHTTGETSAAEEDFDDSQIFNEFNTQSNSGTSEVGRNAGAEENVELESNFEKKNSANTLDESKESVENLEWAENLISAHELADEAIEENEKKDDAINRKLKELTGDWSEDENEDETQQSQLSGEDIDPKSSEKSESTSIGKNEDAKKQDKNEFDKEKEQESKLDAKDSLENQPTIDSSDADKVADAITEDCKGDDVDMLMKNLHKDDTSDALKPDETESKEKSETESVSKDNSSEDVENKSILPILEEEKDNKTENNPSEEFKSMQSPKEEKECQKEGDKNERDDLLTELLDKSHNIKDEQEFLPEEKSESLKTTDIVNLTPAADDEKEPALRTEPMKTDADEEPTTTTTDEAKLNVSEKKLDKSETTDRVKSLISEWGDDEDEADVEQL